MAAGQAGQQVQSRIAPGVQGALSQFGQFAGACGEFAAEVLRAAQQGVAPSPANANAAVRAMQSAGLAGPQGNSTLSGNAWALAQEGVATQQTNDWQAAVSQFAGERPVLLEVSNGQALPGDGSGLQYHFLDIVGYNSRGDFLAADSASPAAQSGQLSEYTPAQIAAAAPIGALFPTAAPAATNALSGLGFGVGTALGSVTSGATATASTPAATAAGNAGNALLNWLGVSASAFFWRSGLIVAGGLLVIIGLSLAFSRSSAGQTVIENVKTGAATAAKAAAAA